MPKISVIIPVYNVEEYLKETLDCLYSQTFKDLQIICVNDGSTDKSLDILQEYAQKDDRIQIISQPNKGQNHARNTGLIYASGDYIHFLDSDDLLSADFYEKMYNCAVKNDSDLVYCSCYKFRNGIEDKEEYKFTNKGIPLSGWTTSTVWFFIFKREYVFDFETSIKKYAEDDLFSFLLFRNINSVLEAQDAILYYRQREHSTMHSKIDEQAYVNDRLIVIDRIFDFGLKNPLSFKICENAFFNTIVEEINAMCICKRVSLNFLCPFIKTLIKMHFLYQGNENRGAVFSVFMRFMKILRKGLISVKIKKNLCRVTVYGKDVINIGEKL